MPRDQAAIDAALEALDAALKDPNPDYSWADDLPEAPPIPTTPDETVAIFVPTKPTLESIVRCDPDVLGGTPVFADSCAGEKPGRLPCRRRQPRKVSRPFSIGHS